MKTIRELLTEKQMLSVGGDKSVLEAAELMHEGRVGALLVVAADGSLEGIFTERDLMVRVIVARKDPGRVRVAEVMTRDIFTASPERRVNEVAREMQARHIRHLPVVDDTGVVGVLSLRDLLREHLDAKRHEVRVLTAYIQGEEPGPEAQS